MEPTTDGSDSAIPATSQMERKTAPYEINIIAGCITEKA